MLRRLNLLMRLKAFADDRRGVSALEFAFVAPILIMLYLGLAELTLGMMASRRTAHLAATIGDLAAQSESLTTANIDDLFDIGDNLLAPFDTGTNLKIILSSVKMAKDKNGAEKATVTWSVPYHATAHQPGDLVPAVTTTQISDGESLIMTEVEYDYDSPIGHFLPGQTAFTYTYYHHPRNGSEVACTDCGS
ncbi:MAG TPA: TadE/TadG family type IV pilus assembly protein [Asticcacaulis sp.]|jgi:Flp pilus assembly protein TadG